MKSLVKLFAIMVLIGSAWAVVPNVPFSVTYTCTGGFGPYVFNFPVSEATALTVTLNEVLLNPANYSVVPLNNNFENGGSVTLGASYPCTTGSIVLTRVTPPTQTVVFYDNMPIPMKTFEYGLDKLTEMFQEAGINYCVGIFAGVYSTSGAVVGTPHTVIGSCILGTSCAVTLTGTAVFGSSTSYVCTAQDQTAAAATRIVQTSGSVFTITGTGTDTIGFSCTGN